MADLDILDLGVDGSEDFSGIDPGLADELLGEDPEEMIGNWVAKCNHKVTNSLGDETHPDLKNGFRNLDLTDEGMGSETSGAATSITNASAAPTTPAKLKT